MIKSLKDSSTSLPQACFDVLKRLKSDQFSVAMTYFAAFKAYLSKSAVEPDSQSFPCLCELREFHPSEPMSECDSTWHFFVNGDARERLLDELSFLDSFLLERIRQMNSSNTVLYEDSVLSR